MSAQLTINCVSLGPMRGSLGLRWMVLLAQALKLKLQLLPIVGFDDDALRAVPKNMVVSINGSPWNFGSWSQAVRRFRMDRAGILPTPDNEPPKLLDVWLFGREWGPIEKRIQALRRIFPKALLITHRLNEKPPLDGGALELCPEALIQSGMTVDQVLLTGVPLALDFKHLAREDNYGKGIRVTGTRKPLELLRRIDSSRIAAVHVNPPNAESLVDWVAGGSGDFAEFNRQVGQRIKYLSRPVPVVLEIKPTDMLAIGSIKAALRRDFGEVVSRVATSASMSWQPQPCFA